MAGPFAGLVQYASGSLLEDTCSTLLSFEGNAFDKFIAYINAYYEGYTMTDYSFYVNFLSDPQISGIVCKCHLIMGF